jgi:phosphohistidine phosphatase
MKFLYIIRHAKSNQNFLGNDFERPLNDRGLRDAPEMAKRLKNKAPKIDAFVSSPAVRAKTTAFLFAKEYNVLSDEVVLVSALYHANVETFYKTILALPEEINSVAIFSHNPGITHFVNDLNSGTSLDNMPTCGIFVLTINTKTWEDFTTAKKEYLFFDFPKAI